MSKTMNVTHKRYIAGPAQVRKFEDAVEKSQAVEGVWFDFAERHGATGCYGRERLAGLSFPRDQVPQPWTHRNRDQPGLYVPNRTKAGRAIWKEIEALPTHRHPVHMLAAALWEDGTFPKTVIDGAGLRMLWPSFERLAGQVVIKVPDVPADDDEEPTRRPRGRCRLLSEAEYLRLKARDLDARANKAAPGVA